MERTNTSTEKGKWFFIVKKVNAGAASTYLDDKLKTLYQKVVPNELKFDQVPIPHRAQTRATQAIGSYASVLMGLAGTQDEDTHLKIPMRSRKRVATAVNTEKEDQTQGNTNKNTGKK
eukprot:8096287-Ditylum_brightwellii.AAC.1